MNNFTTAKTQLKKTTRDLSRIVAILSSGGKIFLYAIIAFAVVFGIAPAVSVLLMQRIVNALQEGGMAVGYILALVGFYVGFDILVSLTGVLSNYVESRLQLRASITLNMSILEKTKEFELADFENAETYNLLQRAKNTNIGQLFSFFKSFVQVFQSLITLVVFSLILVAWQWWLVPVIFVMPAIGALTTAYFGKMQFLIQRNRADGERKRWYMQFLLSNDIAFKEIKIFGLGDYLRKKYDDLSQEFFGQDKNLLGKRTLWQTVVLVFDTLVNGALFVYIITRAFFSYIMLGDMIAYTRSISNVKSGVQGLLAQINSIYQNNLYISQYFELMDKKSEAKAHEGGGSVGGVKGIEVRNLSYKYKTQNMHALKNINLSLESGKLVALIGRNGSGKTTLVKILSTLYDDYEGEVLINGSDLRRLEKNDVQKSVGLLFQDFVKYELTLKENVAFGNLRALEDNDAVAGALAKTGINAGEEDLEGQLGFWFQGGRQLSGGEWLKIALSRAFIRDASVYLLDEPNAALDPISERQMLKSFKELCQNKIGVIVSHKISSIKDVADEIVVFCQGAIEAAGTHDELLVKSESYRELYATEQGGEG